MSATRGVPRCDVSRDTSALTDIAPPRCPMCDTPRSSRRGQYCSAACRQRAFRLRRLTTPSLVDEQRIRRELRRRGALVAHTVYECSICGERRVGVRRCPQDQVFCRALGPGGHCPDCEQPVLLADLLELEVMP